MHNTKIEIQMREELLLELKEMKNIGIHVSDKTLQKARSVDLSEYDAISVSDLASLFCELYNGSC
jgi:hypothetical protein